MLDTATENAHVVLMQCTDRALIDVGMHLRGGTFGRDPARMNKAQKVAYLLTLGTPEDIGKVLEMLGEPIGNGNGKANVTANAQAEPEHTCRTGKMTDIIRCEAEPCKTLLQGEPQDAGTFTFDAAGEIITPNGKAEPVTVSVEPGSSERAPAIDEETLRAVTAAIEARFDRIERTLRALAVALKEMK